MSSVTSLIWGLPLKVPCWQKPRFPQISQHWHHRRFSAWRKSNDQTQSDKLQWNALMKYSINYGIWLFWAWFIPQLTKISKNKVRKAPRKMLYSAYSWLQLFSTSKYDVNKQRQCREGLWKCVVMHFLHAPLLQNEGNPDGVMIPLRQMHYHEASHQWPLSQYWSARVDCICHRN